MQISHGDTFSDSNNKSLAPPMSKVYLARTRFDDAVLSKRKGNLKRGKP
jgi:hypothetical protein